MKNFVEPGNTVTVIAPTGVATSGAVLIVGSVAGVAAYTAAAGAEVEVSVEGVFDLAKVPADALTVGSVAKADPATGLVGAAGTHSLGWVLTAAAAGAATVRVRLTPGIA